MTSWVPCPTYGCQNARRADEAVCGACSIKIQNEIGRERARWDIYANEGIRQLEHYLACWAAFDAWLAVHPPV